MRIGHWAALLALVLSSCTCGGSTPAAVSKACSADSDCPAGSVCAAGSCEALPAGPDASDPSGSGDDGGSVSVPDDAGTMPGQDAGAVITDPGNTKKDSDCDGLTDAEEFATTYGAAKKKTDPNNADTDGDGLPDGLEVGRTASVDPLCSNFRADADTTTTTSPVDADTDLDGLKDGAEDKNGDGVIDPGETDALKADTDGDGLSDGVEDANGDGKKDVSETDPSRADTDGDGCSDGYEDRNRNGQVDTGETDPRVPDCAPPVGQNDSDADGIPDDVEKNVTHTDPLKADSDGDGLLDGEEDKNHDGKLDPGETSATSKDTDCDGLSDFEEVKGYRTDPQKADTDGDGLSDGLEVGKTASPEATCTFTGDADPATRTFPTVADSDGDGIDDGVEDLNRNGKVDANEEDPTRRDTDGDGLFDDLEDANRNGKQDPGETSAANADSDGDGLKDGAEDLNRNGKVDPGETDPLSKDSDCDGLSDAEEKAAFKTDPANPDTDGDGLPDGLEVGRTTSPQPGCTVKADLDPATTTLPTSADTDGDGLKDGVEDANRNGRVDPGETDPKKLDSDGDGLPDGIEDKDHDGTVDPGETDPLKADSDGDRIADGAEDFNHDGVRQVNETDPTKADSDGDTCLDGDEDRNFNHVVDSGETNPLVGGDCPAPTQVDTDCDGLPDSVEDKNGNGTVDSGETDPKKFDSDGDGLGDGLERGVVVSPNPQACPNFKGDADPSRTTDPLRIDTDCDGLKDADEDLNKNGKVDPGETDPASFDTDGDGLRDGTELGACTNPDPVNCTAFVADADCGATKTDPSKADTDGDGILDGAEDVNGNGKVDANELNPLDPADATGPVQKACATPRPISSFTRFDSDLHVAAVPDYTETATLTSGGKEVGLLLYDPTHKIAAFALEVKPAQATASAQETAGRALLSNEGALTNAITQGFTSWDGFDGVQATYDQTATTDLKAQVNAVALRFQPGATGALSGTAGVTGNFRIQAEYLRRSANRAVVVMAFVPSSLVATGDNLFRVDDFGNGTALAQFSDAHRPVCEKFASASFPKVDFLWVVDNSGSMANQQAAVANATSSMQQQLAVAPIDWRIATAYTDTDRTGTWKPFTTSLTQFATDAKPGTSGNGTERGFKPIQCMLQGGTGCQAGFTGAGLLLPTAANDTKKIRTGAKLVIVWLSDAREQSGTTAPTGYATWNAYFQNLPGGIGKPFIGGIVCPVGATCPGEELQTNEYRDAVNAVQGIEADIRNTAAIDAAIAAIIKGAIGSATTTRLARPPISASIKVAIEGPLVAKQGPGCNKDDVPRSRTHGFDFDGASKTVVFYGDCRPDPATPQTIAASYRYWVDLTPNPDGNPPPCGGPCPAGRVCNPTTNVCECPADCGGCGTNLACDVTACQCVCPPDCGGRCSGNFACNTSSCGCVCQQNVTCGAGFRFDTASCACVCDTTKLDCGPYANKDAASCGCVCKPDCGGCPAGKVCNATSCDCACDPTKKCGPNQVLDPNTCACVCDTASIVCPAGEEPDAASCGCVCRPDCGGCGPGTKCDVSSCACVCDLAAPCGAGLKRDPATCACICDASKLNCAAPLVADASSCACVCPADCGGCGAGQRCDAASCSCRCDTSVTCSPGFTFDTASCRCVCDTAALNCGPTYNADPNSCACVCKPDCGGCTSGKCDLSTCSCKQGPK